MAKCGRCGERNGVSPNAPRVWGYGALCSPCRALCSFPVEEVAAGVAALATGAVRLPLGFTSYRSLRERREAAERARAAQEAAEAARRESLARGLGVLAEAREAEERREALRGAQEALQALRTRAGRLPRARRAALSGRIAAAVARVQELEAQAPPHPLSPVPEEELQDAPGFPDVVLRIGYRGGKAFIEWVDRREAYA
jgi:hypothetical protein